VLLLGERFCFGGGAFLLLLLCYDFICASIATFAGADAIFCRRAMAKMDAMGMVRLSLLNEG
jgi:hypothetical protein